MSSEENAVEEREERKVTYSIGSQTDATRGCIEDTDPLTCPVCQKKFKMKGTMNRHLKEIHTRNKMYNCWVCDKQFTRLEHRNIHIEAAHKDPKMTTTHKCDICEKEFRQIENLMRHKNQVHLNKRYECRECPATFSRKEKLDNHMKNGKHRMKFDCNICKQSLIFKTIEVLQKHVIAKQKQSAVKITCKGSKPTTNYEIKMKSGGYNTEVAKEEFIQAGLEQAR